MLSSIVKKLKKEVHSEFWLLKGAVLGVVVVCSVLALLAVFWGESQPHSAARVIRHSPAIAQPPLRDLAPNKDKWTQKVIDRVKSETSATTVGSTKSKTKSTRTRLSDNWPKGDRTVAPTRDFAPNDFMNDTSASKRGPKDKRPVRDWKNRTDALNRHRSKILEPRDSDEVNESSMQMCRALYCDLSTPRVIAMSHHKTGYILSRNLLKAMADFCDCIDLGLQTIKPTLPQYIRRKGEPGFKPFWREEVAANGYSLFHFNRKPVNTIVSGYLYHKQNTDEPSFNNPLRDASYGRLRLALRETGSGQTDDEWRKFSESMQSIWSKVLFPRIAQNGSASMGRWPVFEALNSGTVEFEALRRQTLCVAFGARALDWLIPDANNETRALFARVRQSPTQRRTLRTLYRTLPQSLGLTLELTRYLNCEYWGQLTSHLSERWLTEALLPFVKANASQTAAAIAQTTVRRVDLDSMNRTVLADDLLDAFNIKVNDANAHLLALHLNVSSEEALEMIANNRPRIRQYLILRSSVRKSGGHITANRVDVQPIRESLVKTNLQLCELLKRMTVEMQMDWDFTAFC